VLEEGLAISREIGERRLEAHALAALGLVCMNTHDPAGAAACFEESRGIREALGDRAGADAMQARLAALRDTTHIEPTESGESVDAPLHHRA
jgi:hypothetical protein